MIRQRLLQYLLPWLYNMELVDPKIQPMSPLAKFQVSRRAVLGKKGDERKG